LHLKLLYSLNTINIWTFAHHLKKENYAHSFLWIQKQFCHYNIQQGTNFIYLDMYIFRLMNSLQKCLKPKRLKIQIIFIFIISLSAHIEVYLIKLKVMPFFWVLLQTLEYYFNSRVTLFRGIWIYRPSWAGFNSFCKWKIFSESFGQTFGNNRDAHNRQHSCSQWCQCWNWSCLPK
jgi:hypothetical protein